MQTAADIANRVFYANAPGMLIAYIVCGLGLTIIMITMVWKKIIPLKTTGARILASFCNPIMLPGVVGTGLYYYGEETAFKIVDCSVNGEIAGAVTPGAVAGRAENSIIESCEASVVLDGEELTEQVGQTDTMYESGDQLEKEE